MSTLFVKNIYIYIYIYMYSYILYCMPYFLASAFTFHSFIFAYLFYSPSHPSPPPPLFSIIIYYNILLHISIFLFLDHYLFLFYFCSVPPLHFCFHHSTERAVLVRTKRNWLQISTSTPSSAFYVPQEVSQHRFEASFVSQRI